MPRILLFILFLQLSFLQPLCSQTIQPSGKKDDSLRKEQRQTVTEYKDWSDSVSREKVLQQIEQHGKSLDEFLAEMKEKQRKEERRKWIRIGAGVIFLFALFFAIARRSGKRKKS